MADLTPVDQRPTQVALEIDIIQTNSIAVWITSIFSYRHSFTFELNIRKRESTKHVDTYGFGRPPSEMTTGQVLLGMEFSDGSSISNLPRQRDKALHFAHSWGGLQAAGTRFYSELLPTPGHSVVHFAWPYYDIAERSIRVDTDPILEASTRTVTLWDGESDPIQNASSQQNFPVVIPKGGWFEKHSR